jgi:hypothetical protein
MVLVVLFQKESPQIISEGFLLLFAPKQMTIMAVKWQLEILNMIITEKISHS